MQVLRRQAEIDEEVKSVCQALKRCKVQTNRWGHAFKECSDAVKELGDFENYFQVLHQEMQGLARMIKAVADSPGSVRDQ